MRGRTFRQGKYYKGLNVVALLEQNCRGGAFNSSTQALGQDLRCGAFRRNLSGSWSTQQLVTLRGPEGPISLTRGRTFHQGKYYKGLNVVALLEQNCR
jgi:antirestriction protein ArdC